MDTLDPADQPLRAIRSRALSFRGSPQGHGATGRWTGVAGSPKPAPAWATHANVRHPRWAVPKQTLQLGWVDLRSREIRSTRPAEHFVLASKWILL